MNTLIILSKMPFPEGYASTIRFTTYSRGLIEHGVQVNVLITKPTENPTNPKNIFIKGIHQGISFEYTAGTTCKNRFLLLRPYYNLKGYLTSITRIISTSRKSNKSAILLIGPFGFFSELFYFFTCRIFRIRFMQERSEYPFITLKNSLAVKAGLWFYLHFSCRLYDSMILISNVLADYFRRFVPKKTKLFVMPVVVDPKRFEEKTAKSEERYVAYCGSMNSPKDGIDTLLESFALFTSAFPDIQLKLIGRTDFSDFARLKKKLSDLSLNDRVQFTGRVTNEEMAMLLKNAVMLVLARPDSVQAKANFPTKIGEYCATGKPIVTTRVGSITDFFSDGINIFLAEPDNPISFSTKMREVMNNYPSALNIGEEGRKLASTVLNYNYQGKRLSDFVFSLHHD